MINPARPKIDEPLGEQIVPGRRRVLTRNVNNLLNSACEKMKGTA